MMEWLSKLFHIKSTIQFQYISIIPLKKMDGDSISAMEKNLGNKDGSKMELPSMLFPVKSNDRFKKLY
jgi:hypothetical protein